MSTITTGVRNYFKLDRLLAQSFVLLRQLFKKRYSLFNGGQLWDDTSNCGSSYLTNVIKKNKKFSFTKDQNTSIAKGDSDQWDLTILISLLINADRPITLSQVQIQELDCEDLLLKQLKEIRNDLSHNASKSIDDIEFSKIWTDLAKILVEFGETDRELEKLKDDSLFKAPTQPVNEENVKEGTRLNGLGTQAHKDGKFSDAIAFFTKATDLEGVLDHDRAVFYSNRSSSRLVLYETQHNGATSNFDIYDPEDQQYLALKDAKEAKRLWPTWWKSHFRIGKAYAALNEHDRAINSFERALAIEPTKLEIRKELEESRQILGRQMRHEHLDSRFSPLTVPEQLNVLQQRAGINPESLRALHSLAEQMDLAAGDVLKGYKYECGDVDTKQDYEQAVKYYEKAANKGSAAGMYYLAQLTDRGLGVKKDHNMALQLLKQAATQSPEHTKLKGRPDVGVAEAEYALGLHYADGVGVDKNPGIAASWYRRAIEHENAEAANSLAVMYQYGDGVEQNLQKAEELFALSARQGYSNAMINLAQLLLNKNDFEMARTWFDRACASGNILAQTSRGDFKNRLRVMKEAVDNSSPGGLRMSSAIKGTMNSLKLSKSICELSNEPSKYDYNVLKEYADRGSIMAKRLCDALEHFTFALQILMKHETLTEKQEDIFVHELSECYRLEEIVAQFPRVMREKSGKIVDRVLRRCREVPYYPASQLDEDARICYAVLRMDSHGLINEFVNACQEKYPKSIIFFELSTSINGWLKQYDTVVYKANVGLELYPTNSNLLIDKAVAWRLLEKHEDEAVEAYKSFLAVAPRDHRKVPDAYYSMAMCYLVLKRDDQQQVANKMYEQGKEAEKLQLPCFLPYECNLKSYLKTLFNIESLIDTKVASSVVNHKSCLTDPNRIKIIKRHRKWQADISKLANQSQTHIPINNIPRLQQQTAKSLIGLKAISLREMNPTKDHVYHGYVLSVTIIEEAYTWIPSIHIVIEDEHHDCEQMFIFKFPEDQGEYLTSKVFTTGSKMHIINPYHRLGANDMQPLIRIDDFLSIIMQSESERVINMCQYCSEPNAQYVCSKCNKARYCSKDCQTMDWKLCEHKLICKK